ncbi:MAG: hypothetical protein WC243_03500, partial [Patescibacteria group bacterium]
MFKKLLWIVPLILIIAVPAFIYIDQRNSDFPLITPLAKPRILEVFEDKKGSSSFLKEKEPINILLLGIDRRSKQQMGFNTDVMILVSIDP